MLTSELIHLTSPTVEQYFGDKVYMGKEQILSWGYAFILPKSSPLKASCAYALLFYCKGACTYDVCTEGGRGGVSQILTNERMVACNWY